MNVCTAEVTASQYTTVDLSNVDPRLMSAKSLANITINRISYTVDSNSLNTDLPPAIIYLAPHGVTFSQRHDREEIWNRSLHSRRNHPDGQCEPGARRGGDLLVLHADLSMPFNLIVQATLDIPSGAPVPSGAVQITVTGKLQASP